MKRSVFSVCESSAESRERCVQGSFGRLEKGFIYGGRCDSAYRAHDSTAASAVTPSVGVTVLSWVALPCRSLGLSCYSGRCGALVFEHVSSARIRCGQEKIAALGHDRIRIFGAVM